MRCSLVIVRLLAPPVRAFGMASGVRQSPEGGSAVARAKCGCVEPRHKFSAWSCDWTRGRQSYGAIRGVRSGRSAGEKKPMQEPSRGRTSKPRHLQLGRGILDLPDPYGLLRASVGWQPQDMMNLSTSSFGHLNRSGRQALTASGHFGHPEYGT